MSRLDVNSIRHTAGSADNITLDGSKNVTCENNLTVDGTTTLTGAVTLPNDTVDEAKLKVSNSPSNGQFLSAQSGNTGGLTWATVSSDPTTTSGTNNFTVADGNLVIGTAGHGVDFSANTQSAVSGTSLGSELLDWYEEGTFTPTIEDWGSETAGNTTHGGDNHGKYTRIGNTVFIQICAHQTSNSSSSGNRTGFYVGGLPFTQDTTDFGCMWDVHTDGITADSNHHVVLAAQQANSQKFRIYNRDYDSNSSGWPDLPTGEFRLFSTFHYRCT
jgi:hypothetical protein